MDNDSSDFSADEPVETFTATQQPPKLMTCTLIPSNRLGAHPWLQDEMNYTYRRKRKNPKTGVTTFQCTERMVECCKALATYDPTSDTIASFTFEHNHASNAQKTRAMLEEVSVVNSMVVTCSTQALKPNNILAKVLRNLEASNDAEALPYVVSKECLRGRSRRARVKAKLSVPDKTPTCWEDLIEKGIPKAFTHLKSGALFLR